MAQIDAALAYLKAQDKPNVREAARRFNVCQSTLQRRFKGQTVSRAAARAESHQLLNTAQEDALVQHLNDLTKRHLPPSVYTLRNLAAELAGRLPGKNWPAAFLKRHQDRLLSRYLHRLDRARCSAEQHALYTQFYALVLWFLRI